ncbi:hypothetical protein C8R46DRAFT_369840 [Mycena filopes]|nr:hypothetical protein C8R46DRAFT_369840 [Mycena filopes]
MHRCWRVNELTSMIFALLGPIDPPWIPPYFESPQCALSRLARTCRHFTNPALDLLWEEHHGIYRLLKCLPKHTWAMLDGSFTIQTILEPEDWDRVFSYSARIRVLNLDRSSGGIVLPLHTSVAESIGMTFPRECILPNMHTLRLDLSCGLFPCIHLLLSPTLRDITLELCGPFWRLGVLQLLQRKSPFLKMVSLSQDESLSPSDETDAISSFLAHLPQLTAVTVESTLNSQGYRSLAALPHLEYLYVGEMDTDPFPAANNLPAMAYFPTLLSLKFETTPVEHAIRFLSRVASGDLRKVEIGAWVNHPMTTDAFALCSATQSHYSSISLTSIEIDFRTAGEKARTSPRLYTMTPNTLRPLLSCSKIQVLKVTSILEVCLDDAFVAAMALAWPAIRHLSIYGHHRNPIHPTTPTIMGLLPLSRCCPQLRVLHLVVDATSLRMDDPSRSPRVLQTALKSLRISNSPRMVAEFLSSVFPALTTFTGRGTTKAQWEQVSELMPIYAGLRADERRLGADNSA